MSKYAANHARRGAAWVIIIIVLAVLGAAGGGLYYASQNGLIEVPYLSPKPPDTKEMISYFKSMKSAELTVVYDLQVLPPSEESADEETDGGSGAIPAVPGLGLDPSSLVSDQISLKGQAKTKLQAENKDLEASIKGQLGLPDMTINVDLAAMLIGKAAYVQVNSLPIPLVDLKPLSQTWVQITGPASSNQAIYGTDQMFLDEDEEEKAATESEDASGSIIGTFWQRSLDNSVWQMTVSDRSAEYLGESAWDMLVAYDTDRLINVIKSIYENPPDGVPDEDIDEFKDKYKSDAESGKLKTDLETLKKEMTVKLTVLRQTRQPIKLFVLIDHQPGTDADADDRPVKVMLTVTADKVNQTLTITAPSEAISIETAVATIMGLDEDRMKLMNQFGAVDAIRHSLAMYESQNGSYPSQLSDLVGLTIPGYNRGTVAKVPYDAFTEKPFVYRQTSDGYELDFQIHDPDGYYVVSDEDEYAYYDEEAVQEGLNTADQNAFSKQVFQARDSDNDGLTDYREQQLGLDPEEADTDGDGFDDKAELDGGYDPLTNAETGMAFIPRYLDYIYDVKPVYKNTDGDRQISDVKQIQTALELYFADNNGYPETTTAELGETGATQLCGNGFTDSCSGTTYMRLVPDSPAPASASLCPNLSGYQYQAIDNGTNYRLDFCLIEDSEYFSAGPLRANYTGIQEPTGRNGREPNE
jgi:hypothetical protein